MKQKKNDGEVCDGLGTIESISLLIEPTSEFQVFGVKLLLT